jgi:hypothetical protein
VELCAWGVRSVSVVLCIHVQVSLKEGHSDRVWHHGLSEDVSCTNWWPKSVNSCGFGKTPFRWTRTVPDDSHEWSVVGRLRGNPNEGLRTAAPHRDKILNIISNVHIICSLYFIQIANKLGLKKISHVKNCVLLDRKAKEWCRVLTQDRLCRG